MKFEFSPWVSENPLNINFYENLSGGSQVVPFGTACSNFSDSPKSVLCEMSCFRRVTFEVSVILVRCSVTFQRNGYSKQYDFLCQMFILSAACKRYSDIFSCSLLLNFGCHNPRISGNTCLRLRKINHFYSA